MITRENIKTLIETIEPEEIREAINQNNDYIYLQTHIFNVGGYATIEAHDYSEDLAAEADATGNIFCSKDDFLRLCDELEVFEY